jgi:hypothetical protein
VLGQQSTHQTQIARTGRLSQTLQFYFRSPCLKVCLPPVCAVTFGGLPILIGPANCEWASWEIAILGYIFMPVDRFVYSFHCYDTTSDPYIVSFLHKPRYYSQPHKHQLALLWHPPVDLERNRSVNNQNPTRLPILSILRMRAISSKQVCPFAVN